jgi:hypothetical protein
MGNEAGESLGKPRLYSKTLSPNKQNNKDNKNPTRNTILNDEGPKEFRMPTLASSNQHNPRSLSQSN